MKSKPSPSNRHSKARALALRNLALTGPFIEGTLSPFKRPGCAKPGWNITFKQKGRTRTVYVPLDLVGDVKSWIRTYKQLKKLIRQVTRHSLGLIRGHVANRRAASRFPASTRR
jgi:hypothetical protein